MKLLIVNIQITVNSNSNRRPYCHSPCQGSPVIIDHSEQEPHTALPALPERHTDGGDTAHTLLIGGTIGVGTLQNIEKSSLSF